MKTDGPVSRNLEVKSPGAAGFLGLIPGLGSAYNGLIIKALVQFAVVVGLWEVVSHLPRFLSSPAREDYVPQFRACLAGIDVVAELRASLPTRFFNLFFDALKNVFEVIVPDHLCRIS